MTNVWLGIDPGNSGAFALLDETKIIWAESIPKHKGKQCLEAIVAVFQRIELTCLNRNFKKMSCGIETIENAWKGSKRSMLAQGKNIGGLNGIALCFGWKTNMVNATEWTKNLARCPKSIAKADRRIWRKRRNCIQVEKIFKFKTENDGIADAILIALFERKRLE